MTRPTLTILFTCPVCGLEKQPVQVRYRRHGESLQHWMETVVGRHILEIHGTKNLLCDNQCMDIKIPVPVGTEGVGMLPSQEDNPNA